jgi:hypothetical protein
MKPIKKQLYSIKYTLPRKDLMNFLSGLHSIQMDMIDQAVDLKEAQGYPEANVMIKHIMELS